ncbi:MAG TPA: DUF2017 family protein [Jatrophihabitantaceae bacterium]|nr:DUF2017 family protein [Jatrophihabitantaceae bacterium]
MILADTDRGPVLRLEPEEAQLLVLMFDELSALLSDDTATNSDVLHRLNPAAYPDDPDAEAEYRGLTESSLRGERDERIAACRAELATAHDVELADPDAARRWLQVLNDLRLALGTRLGVTQDDERDIDPNDPAAQPWIVYSWLTAVQDAVVHALLP